MPVNEGFFLKLVPDIGPERQAITCVKPTKCPIDVEAQNLGGFAMNLNLAVDSRYSVSSLFCY